MAEQTTIEENVNIRDFKIVKEETLPFAFTKNKFKKELRKLQKLPSLTNWTIKYNKKRGSRAVIEFWKSCGRPEIKHYGYNGPVYKGKVGIGYKNGVISKCAEKFARDDYTIIEIYFDKVSDSWILTDSKGEFHRASWANAYRNKKYPHHKSREEIDQILSTCDGSIIY